jgi:hypothetical protein
MTNRLFALTLALLFTLSTSAPASAQRLRMNADWSSVQTLSAGDKVRVSIKDGERLKGRFESATDTDINFTHEGRTVTLRRDTISRVEIGRRNRLRGALVGAGIGGGAGLGTGFALVGASDHFDMTTIPTGTVIGAGIGAGIGAAVGLGTQYETVYESL